MKFLTNYPIRVLATGFVVLTLLSIPLFWFRSLCRISLYERMPGASKNVLIEPSDFVAREIEEDPNIARKSQITAVMYPERLLMRLGIIDYLESVSPGGRHSDVLVAKSEKNWAYFDRVSGQIVCRYSQAEMMPDKDKLYREVQYYIGPDGISEMPEETLGRFGSPVIDRAWLDWGWNQQGLRDLVLYDAKLKRFFKIDFGKTTVVKGPELNTSDGHEPAQISLLDKSPSLLHLNWKPPTAWTFVDGIVSRTSFRREYEIIQMAHWDDAIPYLLVLDGSGQIDLLDKETLELVGPAGRLPATETLFGSEQPATPLNALSYSAKPLFLGALKLPEDSRDEREDAPQTGPLRYAGMIAATLSRDGTALAVTAYDEKGQVKTQTYGRSGAYRSSGKRHISSEEAYFGSAWAPASTIGTYLAENVHPPILSLASYFTASAIEADSGHRALFLLPNSFVAMIGRDGRGNCAERFTSALWWMAPSIILGIWLACRISKNAVIDGLSRKTKRRWVVGTMAFGLPAYITYRLTRPKITLVTCANCGKSRRPDMDRCHRCNSPWGVPELTPPEWRVLDR